jgi:hypothetical protein
MNILYFGQYILTPFPSYPYYSAAFSTYCHVLLYIAMSSTRTDAMYFDNIDSIVLFSFPLPPSSTITTVFYTYMQI